MLTGDEEDGVDLKSDACRSIHIFRLVLKIPCSCIEYGTDIDTVGPDVFVRGDRLRAENVIAAATTHAVHHISLEEHHIPFKPTK